jgi:SnoaL-like protein
VLDLYTDDGVFDAATVYGEVWTGKDELRNFYENAPGAVAHHPTAMFTTVNEDGTATTLCKFIVFFHRQVFSVDYNWELVKVGADWKIRKQTIEVVGKAKLGAEPSAERSKV